jgi:hypothetical protein
LLPFLQLFWLILMFHFFTDSGALRVCLDMPVQAQAWFSRL